MADDTIMVFPDVNKMYPNVPPEEGLASIERRLQTNPSPLGLSPETIVSGLKICLRWNYVQFQDMYYLPNRGVAMGACHACDFADIWMGNITVKHLDTCPLETLHFILYRDDGLDQLRNGKQEIRILQDHLNNLHPNLSWTLSFGKEDLWLMIENGRIEWKN